MKKFLGLFSIFFGSVLFAHDDDHANNRWIHVTGVGESVASPDLAILRLGVITTAKSAKLATELNNESIAKIFRVLKDLGLNKNDLETDRFQLLPQRQYRKGLAPLITGYQVTNSLVLRIRELDRVGEIMQSAIDAGGNNFESLSYAVEDDAQHVEKARLLAVENALFKAMELTEPLDAKVGKPLTIQELSGHPRPMQERRMMQADMMVESVPVQAPSELRTEVRVQVKFELE